MSKLGNVCLGVLMAVLVTVAATPAEAVGPQGVDVYYVPEWEVSSRSFGGKLLLSDSPEMVTEDGILYQDQIEGKARLFFYHVNAANAAKKMEVLLENNGKEAAQVTVTQHGLGGPGFVWLAVGKETLTSYLSGGKPYQIQIPAGKSVQLSASISEIAVLPNMLIHGIYDLVADRPVNVKVMMLPVLENSIKFSKTAKVLAPDTHYLRGTFDGANREVIPVEYNPQAEGPLTITLADNKIDLYLRGVDATNGKPVINYGNYGVLYTVSLPTKGVGRVSYYLLPRGGDYAGAIGIENPYTPWGPLATPLGRLHFGSDKSRDFAFLGTYDSGEPLSITFSPPGGSNLPVMILAIPQ